MWWVRIAQNIRLRAFYLGQAQAFSDSEWTMNMLTHKKGHGIMLHNCILRRPDFGGDSPITFFWIPWGMYEWPWRGFGPGRSFSILVWTFYNSFYNNFLKNNFTKRSNQDGKWPPWAKSSSGPHIHTPKIPKKGDWWILQKIRLP